MPYEHNTKSIREEKRESNKPSTVLVPQTLSYSQNLVTCSAHTWRKTSK